MEIYKCGIDTFNFTINLNPLFEAMEKGDVISEITLNDKYKKARGENIIIDFEATDYHIAQQSNFNGSKHFDFVNGKSINNIDGFYMNWVDSFKL